VHKVQVYQLVDGDAETLQTNVIYFGKYTHYQQILTYFIIVIFFKAQANMKALKILHFFSILI
jgi:hypothetical protein